MMKRTKIIATLGPSTDDHQTMERLIKSGLDIARLNYSHGDQAEQSKRIQAVRTQARRIGKEITIIADLQGPKIRITKFINSKMELKNGAKFTIDDNRARRIW